VSEELAAPGRTTDGATAPHGTGHAVHRARRGAVVLAALGVVFGDIGTSPLYALQTAFSVDHGAVRPTPEDVYGVISMIFWSVTLIVSIKYVTVVMRADNDGEGGVMALTALARRVVRGSGATKAVMVLGVLGASLFYGDSVITPAISVLSAVEGLEVVDPALHELVLPIAGTILTALFAVQRWGTHRVGSFFGPVMVLWFGALALSGAAQAVRHPGIVTGLSPTYAVGFVVSHPLIAFIAMGAVVLSITGAEALYADMGHFGRPPIRQAWFTVAFPALTLNYLGQGALILREPGAVASPFFLLQPGWARLPMVVLATAATIIASQAVISGAFSVSRQASRLGFLPPLTVRQTSEHEGGQVYLPAVNAALFVAVLALMFSFGSSQRLATAYGVSVTGALLIDTTLMLLVARALWGWSGWKLVVAAVAFGGTEATFLAANLTKIAHGGWLPLLIATVVFVVMTTWQRGREIVTANRTRVEGPLRAFVEDLHARPLPRVSGTAVFPHPSKDTTPLALRANVEHNRVLHEEVVIVSAHAQNVPHVPQHEQLVVDDLGYADDGIFHLTVRYGFSDEPNIPGALRLAAEQGKQEVAVDPDTASYFLSRATLRQGTGPGMHPWRKRLFIAMAHNAANPAEYFCLPQDQTVVMGSHVDI
jgi:KUP system potassium uptake protein